MPTSHSNTGVLAGVQSSALAGETRHADIHGTTGVLAGTGAYMVGQDTPSTDNPDAASRRDSYETQPLHIVVQEEEEI